MEGVLWRSPHDARKMSLPHQHKQSGCKSGAHPGPGAQDLLPHCRWRHSPYHPAQSRRRGVKPATAGSPPPAARHGACICLGFMWRGAPRGRKFKELPTHPTVPRSSGWRPILSPLFEILGDTQARDPKIRFYRGGDTKVHHHRASTLIPATALFRLDFFSSLLPSPPPPLAPCSRFCTVRANL